MKRILRLSLVLVLAFCSCQKTEDSGFDLLDFSTDPKLMILDPSSYDVLEYSRDNADIESLIKEINAIEYDEITTVDLIDYKEDTPCVTLYLDEGEYVLIFKVWSMGNGECAVTEYVVGGIQVLYTLTFKSEKVAGLTEKIYSDFRG